MLKKVAVAAVMIFFMSSGLYIASAQGNQLTDSVLRLHVLANSDDPADQALKLEVKDEIVKYMQTEFKGVNDVEQARKLAIEDRDVIKHIAEQKIKARGYDYPVEVYIGEFDFPVKSYGNMVFPAGKYQAVRVIIGKGEGKNWWCVLFPPLCLVSSNDRGMSLGSVPEAQVTFKCLELLPKGLRFKDL